MNNTRLVFGIIFLSGSIFLLGGCSAAAEKIANTENKSSTDIPPLEKSVKGTLIEISYEEFTSTPHITREIEITYPGSLVISLSSNPTTGFQWEEVQIGDSSVLSEYEHNFVSPETTGVVGASGKDVWTFKPLATGRSTLIFEYSKPWEGGEKDVWTLGLTVVVK